jgi:hypothetical protein
VAAPRESEQAHAPVGRVLGAPDQAPVDQALDYAAGHARLDAQGLSQLVDGRLPAGKHKRERAELLKGEAVVEQVADVIIALVATVTVVPALVHWLDREKTA